MALNMDTREALSDLTTTSPSTAKAVEEKANGESSVNPAATAVTVTKNQRPVESYRLPPPPISYSQIVSGQTQEQPTSHIPNSAPRPSNGNFAETFRAVGHLIGKAKDWFEVIGSSYVTGTATDFAQLKQALTNSFLVVRNKSELEAEFYSAHLVRSQAPSDFVYKLLKIQKILGFEMTEENLLNHIIMRLSPQYYVEIRNPTTKAQLLQSVEKERDEGVVETDGLDGEGSRAEQVENEYSKGLAKEETSKRKQWRSKRMISEGSTEYSNKHESQHQSKERPSVRRNWRKRSAPSSLIENTEVQRRPHESCKWRKRPIPVSLQSRGASVESQVLSERSIFPTQQVEHQREASGNRKDNSIPDKSRRSRNSEEQE
ncbi:uncharacterized protein NPIL_690671 [Nephila pilipes]|uniref:Retrotransposon gag domain-containing protein n=1 Tax=Nephila pilipes TaxID=299642 RepID=A0A8X6TJE9_NEPPI|nr:uncharacterized protein NPIL_690671 [Nephila pilipes]